MAETRIRLDKQIQKAPAQKMVPLSDGNGELQFAAIDGLIKTAETLTRLNSVEVVGGNLVIKYTPEDGNQQVVSTPMNFIQQDIKISDAHMENPSAGVYRLIITETDGKSYPVDLSALLAVVTQSTEYAVLAGNGTPQNPLRVDLTEGFWNSIPRNLYGLRDVSITDELLNKEGIRGGTIVLYWDGEVRRWLPRSIFSLENLREVTETFRDLSAGKIIDLKVTADRVMAGSLKVYRNGMRQEQGADFEFGLEVPNQLVFFEPFTDRYREKVIVDYRTAA